MSALRIVLLRPRNADNLGAIARAMKNFGLTDWVVVSPNPKLLEAPGMHRLAVKAGELLEEVRLVETLEEAVADCHWVVGTTMRRVEGQRRLTARDFAEQARDGERTVGLVFGDERSGLSNDDLKQCHALSFIPSHVDQPSLNLAQAVLAYAYEWSMAVTPFAAPPGPALADDAALRTLEKMMGETLSTSGFLRGGDHAGTGPLLSPLIRGKATKHEVNLWSAAFGSLRKALRPG
ncbi:MAG: RNA methyltransferase [Myxococcaceae bacterium]|nr:RNA methyltransferase [Myxococcaceae bacterium]